MAQPGALPSPAQHSAYKAEQARAWRKGERPMAELTEREFIALMCPQDVAISIAFRGHPDSTGMWLLEQSARDYARSLAEARVTYADAMLAELRGGEQED